MVIPDECWQLVSVDDERQAWDLLPDDVREAISASPRTAPQWDVLNDFAHRMTAPPPWEPSDEQIEALRDAVPKFANRDDAAVALRAMHDAGLLREDDRDDR